MLILCSLIFHAVLADHAVNKLNRPKNRLRLLRHDAVSKGFQPLRCGRAFYERDKALNRAARLEQELSILAYEQRQAWRR